MRCKDCGENLAERIEYRQVVIQVSGVIVAKNKKSFRTDVFDREAHDVGTFNCGACDRELPLKYDDEEGVIRAMMDEGEI